MFFQDYTSDPVPNNDITIMASTEEDSRIYWIVLQDICFIQMALQRQNTKCFKKTLVVLLNMMNQNGNPTHAVQQIQKL